MPASRSFLGALMFGAFAIGDRRRPGPLLVRRSWPSLAALVLLRRRSETLAGIGGPARDERWAMIDLRATALAGACSIPVIIGAWLVEVARGQDGSPYAQLGAVGGVAYVGAVAFLRWRS